MMETLVGEKSLKIGEVSATSGLPVKTIRYYEEIGLLEPTVERADSGYRIFDSTVLNRLAFIKRSQSLGLTLTEIKDILQVHDRGELPCGEVRHHLEAKVAAIDEQIRSLETLRSELQGILKGWQEHPPDDQIAHTICPNIQPDCHHHQD
ncbi:heavy metal-responsive transcriptional regulator [Laspinema olomoucense]|uniref:Heavy metal-responsive transcriptional regulator n=1 Tax=Laspinema olomoucense D3b TaxID=2953688 RepID=A0ABT2N4F6_9CYAN|nr:MULTISPECIES: heavy metal-responsive transcriptional regulator [unclassified Laspinema]MCT7972339.1 heavy metal-responsive transcriptional regulator [Laspinema sp. D3d]MCT7977462.1 heavy metal-responsive transcriptional regulator [Laspinema sp. D3b]MCT7986875.1 heavy metal-responsive transcriptional regulator [Laspinema sp. D3a]